jgi:hypothetical protein
VTRLKFIFGLLGCLMLFGGGTHAVAAEKKLARGHVPAAIGQLQSVGELPADHSLRLAIGLPLRHPDELNQLLARLYDSASRDYHRFLTPEVFTARFGPTEADYAAVIQFAETNHFQITARHANRLLLDVTGSARDVSRAFHIDLRVFRHPTENRDFFAPDIEPTVAAELPILDVSGFSDMTPPHSRLQKRPATLLDSRVGANEGSASGGAYLGNDFRAAYVPDTTLTGTGQMVGLVQFDGFYSNDIVTYVNQAGLPMVPLQTVLLDNYSGVPTTGSKSGNGEVSLDIEMAIAMAPGLAKVVVYEGGPNGVPNDILNRMAADSAVKQLSCSWGWGGGPSATTDQIFQQMAAQGQSFFLASGDSDAFTTGATSANGVDNASLANAPSDSPYITVVGGTTLTTGGPGGAWASETTWNWGLVNGSYSGSSGGVSSYYSLPVWQQGVNMANNGGSTTFRNLPDVALVADNIYVTYGNGTTATFGGTSCAAPLWAGLMALVNQQAAGYGLSSVGFVNPAIYNLGKGTNYAVCFHDINSGNNAWPSSPNQFYAAAGFDLCTGWGTPAGAALINALAPLPDALEIFPPAGLNSSGPFGGAFSVTAFNLSLTNVGAGTLDWSLGNTSVWLNVSPTNGSLLPGATDNSLVVSLNGTTTNLLPGNYPTTVWFTNQHSGIVQSRQFNLQITEPLLIHPTNGFTATGLVGGTFNTNSQIFSLTNTGLQTWNWNLSNTSLWLNVAPTSGTLLAGGQTAVTAGLNSSVATLMDGTYTATVSFTNLLTGGVQKRVFVLQVNNSLLQNGGFESGNFTGWIHSGNSAYTSIMAAGTYVHTGTYGVRIGPSGSPDSLAQTLATVAGQTYFISFWLDNPKAGTPNFVTASWNGNIYFSQTNVPALGWTNIHFLATASSAGADVLKFNFQNDPAYFGFDDVSVVPVPATSVAARTRADSSLQLTWNTMPGLTYQVQYQTNLFQTNWSNLGSPVTATNLMLTVPDSVGADAQRFYRIIIRP